MRKLALCFLAIAMVTIISTLNHGVQTAEYAPPNLSPQLVSTMEYAPPNL